MFDGETKQSAPTFFALLLLVPFFLLLRLLSFPEPRFSSEKKGTQQEWLNLGLQGKIYDLISSL